MPSPDVDNVRHFQMAAPSAILRPFVSRIWFSRSMGRDSSAREHVLPTGQMHLVFRLAGPALHTWCGAHDTIGTTTRGPLIGGVRPCFYVKDVGVAAVTLGAQLLPGASQALFGISAAELAGAHTPLASVWGGEADTALNRLAAAGDPRQQLAMLDALLCRRVAQRSGLHPQVAQALAQFGQELRIDALVNASLYSHRGFIALFKEATGLGPKRCARLLRFQQVLNGLRSVPPVPLSELAFAAGYSDQAHMTREFREFAGVAPGQYRLMLPAAAHHVPLDDVADRATFRARFGRQG